MNMFKEVVRFLKEYDKIKVIKIINLQNKPALNAVYCRIKHGQGSEA